MPLPSTLDQIHADLWNTLVSAPSQPEHGWRLPVLATADQTQPHARTVVLRSADSLQRLLTIHTDARSPKVAQLAGNTAVSLAFYDERSMRQLTISGTATVHTDDDVAGANWNNATASSRRGYLAPLPPGTVTPTVETNLPDSVSNRVPSDKELVDARANFAVIVVAVDAIDWLLLHRNGNNRAKFRYIGDEVESDWIAP